MSSELFVTMSGHVCLIWQSRVRKKLAFFQGSSVKTAPGCKKLLVREVIASWSRLIFTWIPVGNSPPEITVDAIVFNVTIGVENTYTFVVTDTTSFNVSVHTVMPAGGILQDDGDGRYVFYWTPEAFPTALSFVAEDTQGAVTLHSPILQVCACFNGGSCTLDGVPIRDQLIRNLTCICTEGKRL